MSMKNENVNMKLMQENSNTKEMKVMQHKEIEETSFNQTSSTLVGSSEKPMMKEDFSNKENTENKIMKEEIMLEKMNEKKDENMNEKKDENMNEKKLLLWNLKLL